MEKDVWFIISLPILLLISGALSYGFIYTVFEPQHEPDNRDIGIKREPIYSFSIHVDNRTPTTVQTTFTGSFPDDDRGNLYLIDFGDGNDSGWVRTTVLCHEYESLDTYTLTMYSPVVNGGMAREMRLKIDLSEYGNLSPYAVIKGIPYTYYLSEQPVMLSGDGSYDIDGEVIGYYWEFCDGTHSDLSTGIKDGYQPTKVATHTYKSPGEYQVKLWVMDDDFHKSVTPATTIVRILAHC